MSGELRALVAEMRAEVSRSQRAGEECRDAFTKMMLAAEFGALSKMLLCVHRAAQRIEARSDETPQEVQPEGREPGPQDAPTLPTTPPEQSLDRGTNGQ